MNTTQTTQILYLQRKKTKQAQQNETDPAQQPKQRKQLILNDSKNIFT